MYASLIPSRTTNVNGKEFLFFSGTSYLGILGRPEFGTLVHQGIELWGTNYGASRLGNVSIPVFNQAEEKLATWISAEAAVLVSSGTLAGRLMLEVLGEHYQYHYSPNAHIAINPKYTSHLPHLFDSWIEDTINTIQLSVIDHHVITLNSIDTLTTLKPDLAWAQRLPKNKDVIIVLDDSHGMGVLGMEGRGLYPELKKFHQRSIGIVSLGKAMGLPAGLIAGPEEYIARVKRHPMFGGSSPMIPAYAYAYLHADMIYAQAYESLTQNIKVFRTEIEHLGIFQFTEGFSIFCTEEHRLASYLEAHNIRISHFAYPSPKDRLYTRVIINGLHTQEDMERLIKMIKKF